MGAGNPDNNTKDESAGQEFRGAPNILEAYSGWYANWKPWTVVGWGIKNGLEKVFGDGAAEQGEFENLKIKLVNMASKMIGILKESLGAETQKNGEEILAKEKAVREKADNKDITGGETAQRGAGKTAEKEPNPGREVSGKRKSRVVSKDISATIAKAAARSAVPGGTALISGRGLDSKMPDIGRGRS